MNRDADSLDLQAVVDEALAAASHHRGKGKLADYIPALAEVDPNKMGIAIATGDGRVFAAGDAHEPFSIQSISKVFTLILALGRIGVELWDHVGREPSGSAFNSIVQLESERGKPRNPLINAGAIVTCDQLIGRRAPDEAIAEILTFLRKRSGDASIAIDDRVASSEAEAGNLNRSLTWFIRSFENLLNPVEDVLSVYFRQCGIAMSCAQLARAGLMLAFDGKDPVTGEEVAPWHRARRINSVMMLCGHYDNSGEFAYRVGLPGKSGVGGGILAIVPGVGAIAVWSPGLNEYGTSQAGAVMLEKVVDHTGWTVFA